MCIFTGEVRSVSSTQIFARKEKNKQALVYEMHLNTDIETAMVLPIPLAYSEGASVEFVDLSGCPNFFHTLNNLFPLIRSLSRLRGPAPAALGDDILKVEQVGKFEASFVPTRFDFSRLDPRFQLPTTLFESIPEYEDYGFVVFKLTAGDTKVHPMAFWFTTRHTDRLFFPTVHMHHGEVAHYDIYDHILYAQGDIKLHPGLLPTKEESGSFALSELAEDSKNLVSPFGELAKQRISGYMENKDLYFELNS